MRVMFAAALLLLSSPYEPAAAYSRDRGGFAMAVMVNGKVAFEEYAPGRSPEQGSELASATKSFAGLVAIAAVEDGLLTLDEKVSDTITEWKEDERRDITIRRLLHLDSGIPGGEAGMVPRYAQAIQVKSVSKPGQRFSYGPNPYQVFGMLMQRKLKSENYYDYLTRRILDRIGAKASSWRLRGGEPTLPSGASFNARELMKVGEFVRLRGAWNGKQVVAAKLFDELEKPSPANANYGLTWWLGRDGSEPGGTESPGALLASGKGKQRLVVVREKGVVAVRLGPVDGGPGRRWSDAEFIRLVLAGAGADSRGRTAAPDTLAR